MSSKKCSYILLLLALLITSCAPSQGELALQTATAATAIASSWTATPLPTSTPTITPTPTLTPTPTFTPTFTPVPTALGSGMGKIVFASMGPADQQNTVFLYNIFTINVDGSNLVKLTNNTSTNVHYFYPQWSPDGNQIVYEKSETNYLQQYNNSQLFIMNADGSNVQKISPVPQYSGSISVEDSLIDIYPSWSPDGTKIVFCSNRHVVKNYNNNDIEIYVLDLMTYEVIQLTNGYSDSFNPSWSPDGSKIAFMSDRDGDWDIYWMNIDGSNVENLTQNSVSDRFPRWSPDGSKIIFHTDRDGNIELYTISTDGLTEERITTNPATDATASFSPDGEWIVFHSDRDGDEDIYILKLDGTQIINLTNNDIDDAVAHWSP